MNKIYLNDDSIIHKHHHHKYTKIPCEQVPRQTLLRDKYLSEFKEEWEKDKVKQNLDIPKEFKTINGESIIGKGNIDDTELRNRISNVEKNKAEKSEIPTKTSQLINNSGYIVEADLDPYALYDDIPTTTSELTNDSGFITQDDIPEYENQIVYYDYSPTLNGSKILSLVNSGKKVILRDNMGGDYFNFEFFGYSRMRRAGAAAVDFMLFMCLDGRRITWSGVNGEPGSWETNYDYNVHRSELPTKTSQFINDSGFAYVNEVPSFLDIPTHTSQLLNDSGYLTETDLPIIPTKVSELTNDTGFITRTDLPTKVSELENNVGFITHDTLDSYYWSTLIPKFDEKADKTSLNSYALKSEIPVIPTNISAFTNDAGYLTQHQNLKTINNQSIVGNGNIDIQTNIIDNLNSTSTTDALSANMGRVLKEKVDEIELSKFPNVTIFGLPTIQQGQISDFSTENYLQFPFLVDFHNQAFEIRMCFTTGDNVQIQENIFDSIDGLAFAVRGGHFVVAMSSDGQSWNMGEHIGTTNVLPNTTYYVKFSWNKLQYKLSVSIDNQTYTDDFSYTDTRSLYAKQIVIGKSTDNRYIFGGSINLNHCSLSIMGQEVWQGMDDAGLATRMATNMNNIDEEGKQVVKDIVKETEWYGTQAEFDALTEYDENVKYYIYD